jgi:hypothetical protein
MADDLKRPLSLDSFEEAVEAMRVDAQPWVKPLTIGPTTKEQRANTNRILAQALRATPGWEKGKLRAKT